MKQIFFIKNQNMFFFYFDYDNTHLIVRWRTGGKVPAPRRTLYIIQAYVQNVIYDDYATADRVRTADEKIYVFVSDRKCVDIIYRDATASRLRTSVVYARTRTRTYGTRGPVGRRAMIIKLLRPRGGGPFCERAVYDIMTIIT